MVDSLPLSSLTQWNPPFRLDALGLVTMLGADEVNAAVGRLVRSRYTEYLPILGAFVMASDQFTRSLPGFALYNIDDGITTTDLAGWFARYLQAQQLRKSISTLKVKIVNKSKAQTVWEHLPAILFSLVLNAAPLVLAILQGDWWGIVNVASMLVSVAVRSVLVSQNRSALDREAGAALSSGPNEVRVLCVRPDGKMVTVYTPRTVLRKCFIEKSSPPNPRFYTAMRMLGWLFFAAHVVSIGMSLLLTQIVSVILICASTVFVVWGVGFHENRIGNRLSIERGEHDDRRSSAFPTLDKGNGDRRQNAFVFLEPSGEELQSLIAWNLAPHASNKTFWGEYSQKVRTWPDRKAQLGIRQNAMNRKAQDALSLAGDPEKSASSRVFTGSTTVGTYRSEASGT